MTPIRQRRIDTTTFRTIGAILVVLAIGLFIVISPIRTTPPSTGVHHVDRILTINGIELETMIADQPNERARGLSGHTLLQENQAMLFVFDTPGRYSFWMKDMDFQIDMLWLNADREVVFMKQNADPNDYPETYQPSMPALYVVETIAGFTDTYGVTLGSVFDW